MLNNIPKPKPYRDIISEVEERINQLDSDLFASLKIISDQFKEASKYRKRLERKIDEQNKIIAILTKRVRDHTVDITEIQVNAENYTTKTHIKEDYVIDNDTLYFMDTEGEGFINQFLLISDVADYSIRILIDDNVLYDKDYSYFSTDSDYLESTSAYYDSPKYYFSLRNIQFQKKFQIDITTTNTVTFDQIYIKYAVRKEIRKVS